MNFIKWIEESLVRAPITDIISGSVGLGFGLIVAFLIGYALNAISVPILNTVAPILLTLVIWLLRLSSRLQKEEKSYLGLFIRQRKETYRGRV